MNENLIKFQTALEAYEQKKEAIRKLIVQIKDGIEVHDKNSPKEGINWAYVGDLSSIEEVLIDIKDRLHATGEYKK